MGYIILILIVVVLEVLQRYSKKLIKQIDNDNNNRLK